MHTPISLSDTEGCEAEALLQFETGAPQTVRSALGINATRIEDVVVLSMRNDPTRYWSKALGFGRTMAVTADLVAEVCAFYRAEGTPVAFLQLAPSAIPEDWDDICGREGITGGSTLVKLVADVDEVLARADRPDRRPLNEVRVAAVEAADADQWASVMMEAFGMPHEHYTQMTAASAVHPDWYPQAAWLGDELVGTGTMYRGGRTGQLFGGAVLPHARNRGSHTELLAARARTAHELGCRLVVTEAEAEIDGSHNPSLHNSLGLGFQVAYERRNWVWQPR
ncbi:GNAT family N-acetyltransferase [Streptomyces tendae]|uniref:GNAT family N-acetyltransferase n=1 Tax=Streptomyces tendae TaxID=1932 RepID=UPI003D7479C8